MDSKVLNFTLHVAYCLVIHANVSAFLCVDVLSTTWTATAAVYTLLAILSALQVLQLLSMIAMRLQIQG